MIKLIIAGGRDFNGYLLLKINVKVFIEELMNSVNDATQIVSGKAPGADSLGERFAKENGLCVKPFPAEWSNIEGKPSNEIGTTNYGKLYWKLAGYKRNEEMAKYANACICFWDGKSKGTGHMIDLARKYDLELKIVNY